MVARAAAKFDIVANDRASKQINAVQGGFSNLARASTVLDGPLNGISGRLTAISSGLNVMNPLMLAGGVAVASLAAGLVKSLDAAGEFESQMLRIEALLRSTGQASGRTAAQIDALAIEIGEATLASASGVRDAAGILLTFQTISGETFDRTLRVAQDLAAVMGTDLRSAVLQLGKALEDPERGLTALRRSGVSFTESQRQMIVALSESGRELEAQEAILKRVEQQVGGAGEAEARGLRGAVDSLSEAWSLLLIEIGSSGPVMQPTIAFLRGLRDAVASIKALLDDDPLTELRERQALLTAEIERFDALPAFRKAADGARVLREELRSVEAQIFALEQARDLERAAAERAGQTARAARQAERKELEATNELLKVQKILLGQEDDIRAKLEEDLKKENERRDKKRAAIEAVLGPLRQERAELGLTSEELARYRLGLEKATVAQQDMGARIAKEIDQFRRFEDAAERVAGRFEDAFIGMTDDVGESFSDMVTGILEDLARLAFRMTVIEPLLTEFKRAIAPGRGDTEFGRSGGGLGGILSTVFGGGGGGLSSAIGSIFGGGFGGGGFSSSAIPMRALGGPVAAGGPVLVGERGPELFVPGAGGSIVPNDQIGSSGAVAITFNVNTLDARDFDSLLQERRPQIIGMVESALNRQGRRGLSR